MDALLKSSHQDEKYWKIFTSILFSYNLKIKRGDIKAQRGKFCIVKFAQDNNSSAYYIGNSAKSMFYVPFRIFWIDTFFYLIHQNLWLAKFNEIENYENIY